MNKHALFHKSDTPYAFALSQDTVELRIRTAKGDMRRVEALYGLKYAYALRRTAVDMQKISSDGLFDYYGVRLKLADSRLAYIFRLTDNSGAVYFYSEDGATDSYDFETSYYNFFQLAYINPNDVAKRVDWLSRAVVYQIFVDRFCRAGESAPYINMEWGAKPTPKSFAGGNLDGITSKLDYLCDLGVNTLYLTPIFTSVSNHKYDISDYYHVDEHFGGNAAFARLMNSCKARGVRVVLDAVFNHCSDRFEMFADVVKNGKNSKYHDWFVIHGDKPTKRPLNYEVFASCDYMPKWNTANPAAAEYLCDVGEYWIKNFGIDGWRLDVSDEVSHAFWRKFRDRIKSSKSDAVLIGENWHDSGAYLRGDEFDSIMNYAFTKAMLDFFCNGALDEVGLCERLGELVMRYSTQANMNMLNLIGSHDTHRFYSLCGKDENKLLSALAVEMFMPGATMIYYGDEIPLEGGYDPDSRRCFDWRPHPFTARVKELLRYKKLRAVTEGDVNFFAENGLFGVERKAVGQTAVLLVNNKSAPTHCRGVTVDGGSYKIIVE